MIADCRLEGEDEETIRYSNVSKFFVLILLRKYLDGKKILQYLERITEIDADVVSKKTIRYSDVSKFCSTFIFHEDLFSGEDLLGARTS